jgi:sec-independent protein translocase protein TatA
MFGIGPQELLLILVIGLIVVGPRRLPEIGRSLGKGLREVRKAQDEVRKTIQLDLDDETPPPRPRPAAPASRAEPAGSGSDLAAAAGSAGQSVGEVSRTLGKGLTELRKAREELQRSFRVDLDEPSPPPASGASAPSASEGTVPEPTGDGAPERSPDGPAPAE